MISNNARLIMTPGPTMVNDDVLKAFSNGKTNPDLDLEFFEFYKQTCELLKTLMNTKNDVLILSGEGILGLEAACASVIEPGDRILAIDNGIYGNGFGDFAKMYGAEVIYFKGDYQSKLDYEAIKDFIKKNGPFKAATLVHCETPSGMTNEIGEIGRLLDEHGIISIVDSVSGIGGEELLVDEWKLDIVLGGSQKCISCPPGLTFLSISEKAWNAISSRKAPIAGYYCNLGIWKSWYADKWFPYTQPINNIHTLNVAVENLLSDQSRLERHRLAAEITRKTLSDIGVELYPKNGFANTVTTALLPSHVEFKSLYDRMLEKHGIMIAGGFGHLKDRIFRIGHMGENCRTEYVEKTLEALKESIEALRG